MKTIATLCSGGELFSVLTGLAHLWGVEYEPTIAAVAEMNGFRSIIAAVQSVDYSSLECPWWLHMSPPCTNASNANTQGGETELDIEIAQGCIRAIRTLRPPMVSLENVLGYRKFESFKLICRALREEGYVLDWWHLNSADYGVAQTRRRLFLVASRVQKPRKPVQTHQERGADTGQLSLFAPLPAWIGWYEAIEDLIDELPEDEFADWQLQRLPDELRTLLLSNGGECGDLWRDVEEPAPVVTTQSVGRVRALLVAQGGYDGKVVTAGQEQPAFTATANQNQTGLRAFLMRGDNTGQQRGKGYRDDIEPSQTVGANGATPRAFIVDGQANSYGESVTVRNSTERFCTVTASQEKCALRAYTGGRVVRMMPRCLARFQSIPDSYILPEKPSLACTVIGNAVPPLMAKALVAANIAQS